MKLDRLSSEALTQRFYQLQDFVVQELDSGASVDDFLDNTTLFDEWEDALPDNEYSIFMITVLNNIRKKSVVDVIVSAILKSNKYQKIDSSQSCIKHNETVEIDHPFC